MIETHKTKEDEDADDYHKKLTAVCITLDPESPERSQRALREIQSLGIKDVKFFPGVDGKIMDDDDLKKVLTPRAYYELKNGRYVHEGISGKGSVGCYLAHTNAWKKCLKERRDLVIFEDDFCAHPDSEIELMNSLKEAKRYGFDILRLNHRRNPDYKVEYQNIPGYDLIINMKRTEGTTAYIMTPHAAEKLLSSAFPIDMQLDSYVDMGSFYHNLKHISTKKDFFNDQHSSSINDHNSLETYENGINLHTYRRHKFCICVFIMTIIILFLLGKITHFF